MKNFFRVKLNLNFARKNHITMIVHLKTNNSDVCSTHEYLKTVLQNTFFK